MKTLFTLGFVLLSTLAISQNCTATLSGYIIDLHDNSVLEDATIIVVGTGKTVMTNRNGKYTVSDLCDETYILQVSHPECDTQAVRVTIDGNTTRSINMEHHLDELGEVTIVGQSTNLETTTATQVHVRQEVLDANSAGSLGDALKSLSGVSSLNTGSTIVKPVIQGLHSSRVILITDGARLQDQEWGVEHAPNIDLNAAGEISIIKGAAGLQYGGDAVGGTIIINPARIPVKDTLYGKTLLTLGSNGRGGSITSSLTKSYNNGFYASIQGTLKRFGDFKSPDYVLSNTGVYERNLSARIGVNRYKYGVELAYSLFKNESGILRSSHLGGAEDLVIAINNDRPFIVDPFTYDINAPRQDVTHQSAKIKGFYRFENLGKLSSQIDYQRNNRLEFDIRRDSDDNRPSIDLQLQSVTGNIDFDHTADNTVTLKIGVLGRFQDHFPDPNTGVRRLIPDYKAEDFGIYTLGSKTWDALTLEAGARYDYNHIRAEKFYTTSLWENRGYDITFADFVVEELDNQIFVVPDFTYHNFSATAGLAYDVNNTNTIAVNYALATRAPNVSELFSDGLHQSAARIELGNLSFDQEQANKISASWNYDTDKWSFTVAPFANFISNFIIIEPTGIQQTIRGNFQVWEYRQTDARLLGFDVDNRVALTEKLTLNNQFSLVKAQDTTRDRPIINIPAASTRNSMSYTLPEVHNLKLGLESVYVFEQNEFPNTNFEVFLPQTETLETVDVSTPPAAYHLLNFNGSIDFSVNDTSTLTCGLLVNNILNTNYRDYLNRQRYYADDLGRNILVQLKINY